MAYKQKSEDLSNIAREMKVASNYGPGIGSPKGGGEQTEEKPKSGYDPTPVKKDDIIYEAGELDELVVEPKKPVVYKPLPAVKATTGYIGRAHGN
jgi:hypothetical protein